METVAVTPALLPMTRLETCLRPLRGYFEATTSVLSSYCDLLDSYLSYQATTSDASRLIIRLSATKEWAELQPRLLGLPMGTVKVVLPDFEAIWAEVVAILDAVLLQDPTKCSLEFWNQQVNYRGLRVQPVVILVCDTLMDLSPDFKDWIMHIINSQPRYHDVQGNLQAQFKARELLGANTIPEMARIITTIPHDYETIWGGVAVFARLVQHMIDHHQEMRTFSSGSPTLNQYLNELVDHHRALVSDPFTITPLALRQQLASCDVRGTARLLVWDAATLSDQPSYTGLPWDMFKNFIDGLMHVVGALGPVCIGHVRTALFMLRLDCFLEPDAAKDDTWTWLPEEWDDEYESDGEFDPDDLPEVCFEPIGPTIKTEQYAFAVTNILDLSEEDCSICRDTLNVHETVRDEVPVKIDCGHTFHYGCLSTLINGISKFSNLCPNCRQKICSQRPKRLKDDEELQSARFPGEQDEVEPVRFLQDRYGDVVMTDE
ncbi:hypothetical protein IG631_18000 [Alternaria alternata]|nr:hypothetical protein IG631_18000 [Alternaria alternata]